MPSWLNYNYSGGDTQRVAVKRRGSTRRDPGRFVANGVVAGDRGMPELASWLNYNAARLKPINLTSSGYMRDASKTWDDTNWLIHTSATGTKLRVYMYVMPQATVTTSSPSTYITLTEVDPSGSVGSTTLTFPTMYNGRRQATANTHNPENMLLFEQELSWETESSNNPVKPDTGYQVAFNSSNDFRILSVTIFEEPDRAILVAKEPCKFGYGNASDGFAISGSTITFTAPSGEGGFTSADVGRLIYIKGATTDGNNGAFEIATVTSTDVITYTNEHGATEALSADGLWYVGEVGVNSQRYSAGGEILREDVGAVAIGREILWARQGAFLGSIGVSDSVTSTSYVNAYDSAYSAWNSAAPGIWVPGSYKGDYNSNGFKALVYIAGTFTGGSASDTMDIQVHNQNDGSLGTLTLTSVTGSDTLTGAIYVTLDDADGVHKLDFLCKKSAGPTSVKIESISVFEYEK